MAMKMENRVGVHFAVFAVILKVNSFLLLEICCKDINIQATVFMSKSRGSDKIFRDISSLR